MRQGTDPPATERALRIGGLRLQVRESGQGPPLLLLNGIGAHVGMWRPLEATLPDVRVISYDAPGTGRSETPLLPLTIPALAGLAEGVLDALGCVSRSTCSATRSAASSPSTWRAARRSAPAASCWPPPRRAGAASRARWRR